MLIMRRGLCVCLASVSCVTVLVLAVDAEQSTHAPHYSNSLAYSRYSRNAFGPTTATNTTELMHQVDNHTDTTVRNVSCRRHFKVPCKTHWHTYLMGICMPIIVLLGITGNVLSFIVMGRPSYIIKPYSCYLRALAVCDSLTLVFTMLRMADEICYSLQDQEACVNECFLHKLLATSIHCKLFEFLRHVVYLMSSWLIVLFTIDRYIAVCHPHSRCITTQGRALFLVILVAAIAMVTQAFRLFFIERLADRNQPCHAPKDTRMSYYAWHYFGFSATLRFMLPCAIIAICNGLIVYYITRLRRNHRVKEGMKVRNANLAITTLFVVCGVFVVGLLPNTLLSIIQYTSRPHKNTFCRLLQFDQPFQVLRLINYAINCVLYGMTGRHFRCELHRLLTGDNGPPHRHRHVVRFTALNRPLRLS